MDKAQLINDTETGIRIALEGLQAEVWTAMPGIVKSVNFAQMTCEVQPTIKGSIEDETGAVQSVNLPLIVDVPIVFPSGGGFTITFPIASGDEVLLVFASRCIDAWWQSGGINPPAEARMHDLSDGFAIPGPRSLPHVPAGYSSTSLQIRNTAQTSYIEIDATGKIKLMSATEIDVIAPVVQLTGAVNITGALVVSGALSAAAISTAGAIAASDVSVGTVHLSTHTHPVTTAPGTTGLPT
jgi:Phage protein Gp138 N-terminal domain